MDTCEKRKLRQPFETICVCCDSGLFLFTIVVIDIHCDCGHVSEAQPTQEHDAGIAAATWVGALFSGCL